MSITKNKIARCAACRFYTPVGRRGGECSQLSVPVQSGWKGCCLAESPFSSDASSADEQLVGLAVEARVMLESLPVKPRPFLEPIAESNLATKAS